jgi:16S rRNA A1518/A1519 N6-dimethyltransferase RsmA/KsgA/DIM1 with predicted DNA glycosylase/AP lyase activity
MTFRYKKELGQHFLRQVPKEILFPLDSLEDIQSLQLPTVIQIIEIGPGSGMVTEAVVKQLLPYQKLLIHYTAVDVDPEAIEATKERLKLIPRPKRITVDYVLEDILTYKIELDKKTDFLFIFGSLPYNVSKKIVSACKQISLELPANVIFLPSRFILQREVVDDYLSEPPKAAYLGTELSLYCSKRKMIKQLPPGSFTPPPKVDSAVLEIFWKKNKNIARIQQFSKLLRAGFTAKRKNIGSIMKKQLSESEMTPTLLHLLTMRAHELTLGEWELIMDASAKTSTEN